LILFQFLFPFSFLIGCLLFFRFSSFGGFFSLFFSLEPFAPPATLPKVFLAPSFLFFFLELCSCSFLAGLLSFCLFSLPLFVLFSPPVNLGVFYRGRPPPSFFLGTQAPFPLRIKLTVFVPPPSCSPSPLSQPNCAVGEFSVAPFWGFFEVPFIWRVFVPFDFCFPSFVFF